MWAMAITITITTTATTITTKLLLLRKSYIMIDFIERVFVTAFEEGVEELQAKHVQKRSGEQDSGDGARSTPQGSSAAMVLSAHG